MQKNVITGTFVRIFTIEKNAQKFAKENGGRLTIHYDWDDMKQKIVKQFIVKY